MTAIHLTMYRTDPETGDTVMSATSNGPWYSLIPLRPRGAARGTGMALAIGDNISDSLLFLGDHTHVLTVQQRNLVAARLGVTVPAGSTAGDAVLEILMQGDTGPGGSRWPRPQQNRQGGGWVFRFGDLTLERPA